jgi:hypothetical protein
LALQFRLTEEDVAKLMKQVPQHRAPSPTVVHGEEKQAVRPIDPRAHLVPGRHDSNRELPRMKGALDARDRVAMLS